MSDSTLNMSYVNHYYLNNFCYLQDNYRLDITAIVTRDVLKFKGKFNISFHIGGREGGWICFFPPITILSFKIPYSRNLLPVVYMHFPTGQLSAALIPPIFYF